MNKVWLFLHPPSSSSIHYNQTNIAINQVEKDYKYWSNKRKIRKAAFFSVQSILEDNMTKDDIWEKAGIEEEVEGFDFLR
jgi:hypothetical protein